MRSFFVRDYSPLGYKITVFDPGTLFRALCLTKLEGKPLFWFNPFVYLTIIIFLLANLMLKGREAFKAILIELVS